jgi:hypothetical protein
MCWKRASGGAGPRRNWEESHREPDGRVSRLIWEIARGEMNPRLEPSPKQFLRLLRPYRPRVVLEASVVKVETEDEFEVHGSLRSPSPVWRP